MNSRPVDGPSQARNASYSYAGVANPARTRHRKTARSDCRAPRETGMAIQTRPLPVNRTLVLRAQRPSGRNTSVRGAREFSLSISSKPHEPRPARQGAIDRIMAKQLYNTNVAAAHRNRHRLLSGHSSTRIGISPQTGWSFRISASRRSTSRAISNRSPIGSFHTSRADR